MTTIRFGEDDLKLFAAASGDVNPLHVSQSYAAQTAYGGRVVYGVLGALAALGQASVRRNCHVSRLRADFLRPMFPGVDYQARLTLDAGDEIVSLFDGAMPVLSLRIGYGEGDSHRTAFRTDEPLFTRTSAAVRDRLEVVPGVAVAGRYRTNALARDALCRRYNVHAPASVVDTLLWSSYGVGMELPGRDALFTQFVAELSGVEVGDGTLNYEMAVKSVDTRLGHRVRSVQGLHQANNSQPRGLYYRNASCSLGCPGWQSRSCRRFQPGPRRQRELCPSLTTSDCHRRFALRPDSRRSWRRMFFQS